MLTDFSTVRLAVAFPVTAEFVPTEFFATWTAGYRPMPWVMLMPRGGGPIDAVRNDLVEQFLATDCTHLWFCDTDQRYPQRVLVDMLQHDVDILAAKVHRRYPPYDPILYRGDVADLETWIESYQSVPPEEWRRGGLVEVDSTGFGCVLIKREVFERMSRPWFRWHLYETSKPIGEDVQFYLRARRLGYRVWVDCDSQISHRAILAIDAHSWESYRKATQP